MAKPEVANVQNLLQVQLVYIHEGLTDIGYGANVIVIPEAIDCHRRIQRQISEALECLVRLCVNF